MQKPSISIKKTAGCVLLSLALGLVPTNFGFAETGSPTNAGLRSWASHGRSENNPKLRIADDSPRTRSLQYVKPFLCELSGDDLSPPDTIGHHRKTSEPLQ